MQGHELLHNFIQKSSLSIHKKRSKTLTNACGALLKGKRLTLTDLGRSSLSSATERSSIRGMDRLLGNGKLQQQQSKIYKIFMDYLLLDKKVWIVVDWSPANNRRNAYILRASVPLKGRSYTLYQEVHSKQNAPSIEKSFLNTLASLLPKKIEPIIVTDAGFRVTWFKAVLALGFSFVGRVRNRNKYQIIGDQIWRDTTLLYQIASNKPQGISSVLLTQSNQLKCSFVLLKKEIKGRKRKNSTGTYARNTESKRSANAAHEPWLLATSLPIEQNIDVNKIVFLYEKRMQIEEDFRDTKSHRYGFGLTYSLTNNIKRIEILLLIAAMTSFACWLVALSAQRKGLQYQYQSNSIKNRTVLSVIYLACRLSQNKVYFTKTELLTSLVEMRELVSLESFL